MVGFIHSSPSPILACFVMLLDLLNIEMCNTDIHRNVSGVSPPALGMLTLPVRRPFLGNNLRIKSKQDDPRLTSTNLSSLRVSDHFSDITPTTHTSHTYHFQNFISSQLRWKTSRNSLLGGEWFSLIERLPGVNSLIFNFQRPITLLTMSDDEYEYEEYEEG